MKTKDIEELLQAGIISKSTSDDILTYYKNKRSQSPNRLLPIFGGLGALLVGLGIILILAHNWDQLSKTVKTIFAFTPLVLGQAIYGYVLLKKAQNVGWREGASIFLFLAIGACISLISQIYNIPGSMHSFLLTWMLLSIPLIYLMKSSSASLMFLIGITLYATDFSYFSGQEGVQYWYWILLLVALPHYIGLIQKQPLSNVTLLHHWAFPLSIIISLGTVAHETSEFLFMAYFSLLGICILVGKLKLFQKVPSWANGYVILGTLGSLILLITFSFHAIWGELTIRPLGNAEEFFSRESLIAVALTIVGGVLLVQRWKPLSIKQWNPLEGAFLLFTVIFILGVPYPQVSMILINIATLLIGLWIVVEGTRKDNLGSLNFGLLVISILILCRFLDTDMSFVVRGLIFVGLGVGFFVTNYFMLQKRKKHA